MGKIGVVLFNLGGPDSQEAVRPFLFNLFNDRAIITLPWPLRPLLARLISARRAPTAQGIYEHLGGGSPLLANTEAQAEALEAELIASGMAAKVFIAMRYWHPFSDETVRAVARYGPEKVVLLPLYPQFSTTTSRSSFQDWQRAARRAGLSVPTSFVCCYPINRGFVAAVAANIRRTLVEIPPGTPVRVLFSAHGLPKQVISRGDPYQWQVEHSATAVMEALSEQDLDWIVCYQSRVGPLEWIGPATDAEVERAARDGVGVVLVPIAFVSEHSETLVELDLEYAELAREKGVQMYRRVPTVAAQKLFIEGLTRLVQATATGTASVSSGETGRICPGAWTACPLDGAGEVV